MAAGPTLRISFAGKHEPHLLRVRADAAPLSVRRDGKELAAGSEWRFAAELQTLIVRTGEYERGEYEIAW